MFVVLGLPVYSGVLRPYKILGNAQQQKHDKATHTPGSTEYCPLQEPDQV